MFFLNIDDLFHPLIFSLNLISKTYRVKSDICMCNKKTNRVAYIWWFYTFYVIPFFYIHFIFVEYKGLHVVCPLFHLIVICVPFNNVSTFVDMLPRVKKLFPQMLVCAFDKICHVSVWPNCELACLEIRKIS